MTDQRHVAAKKGNYNNTLKTSSKVVLGLVAGAMMTFAPSMSEASRDARFLQAKMTIAAPSAAKQLCTKYDWACSTSGSKAPLTQDDVSLVRAINIKVNRQIREVSDQSQYRTVDYWTLPASLRGDCEDIALLKKKQLIKAGIAPERLLMATVLDRNRQGHAVLIFRTGSGDYVLDNLTNKIKSWKSTGYTFLRMQNPDAPRKWVGLMVRG